MISILSMVKTGQYRDFIKIRFEFEFDDASLLPIGTYTWGVKTYFIEEGSKARDTINNIYYEYIKGKWSKIITPPIPTFKTPKNTTYNDNGEYSVSNNDLVGFNDIKVDVSSTPPTLIEKSIIENGTYNATDDSADGYSSVNVDVANSYTTQDEGKVVSDGVLVDQTAMPEEVTENGTINTTLYNSVTVNVSGGGAGGSDVIFYDYDGSVVASYSAADFANLSAMPNNPTHDGLTAQGWNWSLSDAKSYVAAYGRLNIGQMYITSDGKTRFYLTLINNALTVDLWWLYLQDGTTLDIDWGDGSQPSTWTKGEQHPSHTYSTTGDYVITITVIEGSFYFASSDSDEITTVRKIELGNNVTFGEQDSLLNFYKLEYITIPKGITELGPGAFTYCNSLKALILPDTLTSIDNMAINGCYALSALSIGRGVTLLGSYSISGCYSLTSIVIPDTVTTLHYTAIDNCNVLLEVIIPNSITTIADGFLTQCSLLPSVVIPENVTTIGAEFLRFCGCLSSITFKSTTPPTLAANLGIPPYCAIRIPQGSLSAYTSASNYPDPAYYVYEEY